MLICKMFGRKFLLRFNRTSCFQRPLTTSWNVYFTNDDAVVSRRAKQPKKTENIAVSTAVRDYLKDAGLEYFMDSIPKKLLRKQCSATSKLCLFDQKTSKELASMISEDLMQNTSFVIECNPGIGLLTRELLKIGVPSIHLYEKFETFCSPTSPLGKLIIQHNNRLDLRKLNFFDVWMTLLHDNHTVDDLGDIYLTDMPYREWKNEPFAQIIAFCPSKSFFSLLIHNFFHQTKLFEHGRATFFLVMPANIWERAKADTTCEKKLLRFYNQYTILLHLFFEFKCLGELPRKAFAPWPEMKLKNKIYPIDIPMQVIKLEPKSNTFDLISKEDLKSFWFFLKHGMRSKKTKVISEMENWIPGCGPKLIALDMDICTRFKELSPAQLFELYRCFRSWPEYDENFFTPNTGYVDEIKKDDDEKIEFEEPEPENVICKDNIQDDSSAMRYSSVV